MEENNESIELQLDKLITLYKADKEKETLVKKSVSDYNTTIKKIMNELGTTEWTTTTGLIAKITIQNRDSFNNDALVKKLKELGLFEAIDTVEVPDMDKIEDLIYNGKLNAANIADCKITKQVETLSVKENKNGTK